ncbi:L-threonylcarbamoyladenylate synthase [uncultured Tyzzerella sp.]|uniref:L-threonylcarbamoyladenylate synthase n=1 Tax=uncultured Tyzzerella sp. TaxID=2321398 RepID=UPI002942DA03|nr:L-threonylcarbamoyladenylate synthase [uncultured Tyzzerella sp.]
MEVVKNIKNVVVLTKLHNTVFEKVDSLNPSKNIVALKKAANILKNNGLVAFPTETVYGLGANALKEDAVKKIYIAKGRPSDNPLIVHIADKNDIYPLVDSVPKNALILMDKFWPGALTIILKKSSIIPITTSGGLDTVAIRMPNNKIALSLIKECGFPLAAPSANTSTKPSPTLATHVYKDLNGKIDMIIDGGSCAFGIESTVVEVFYDNINILRPGSITKEMLETVITNVTIDKAITDTNLNLLPKSPGMKYKHYAPLGDVFIVDGEINNIVHYILKSLKNDKENNIKSIVIASSETINNYSSFNTLNIGSRQNLNLIAKNLFNTLRECDNLNIDKIYIESFLEQGVGLAVMNRLKKAASYKIINV